MRCRNCDCWSEEGDANGAGMCENSVSPCYGCWTYPGDGCDLEDTDDDDDDDDDD